MLPAINNHHKGININSIMLCNQEARRCHPVREVQKYLCKVKIVNSKMFTVKTLSVEVLLRTVWRLGNISIEMEAKKS